MKLEGVANVEVSTIRAHSGGSEAVSEDAVPVAGYTSLSFKFWVAIPAFDDDLRVVFS